MVRFCSYYIGRSCQRFDSRRDIRRLIIRKPDGGVLPEVPFTVGVAVGGAVAFVVPVMAAIGAMAAL
ncbi:hypothetical protein CSA56_04215 [candidate division KSB3 bacterium]|uniref:DUF4342 domain-containing protein n=1 Tax=candidate division KSB3 bacterium TaxID=2044937 RepID=A0A2G6KIF0_9BACT|nr:MAG: hypothetical protein CSA56_04215 [candidate division KSB3 bacterium]